MSKQPQKLTPGPVVLGNASPNGIDPQLLLLAAIVAQLQPLSEYSAHIAKRKAIEAIPSNLVAALHANGASAVAELVASLVSGVLK